MAIYSSEDGQRSKTGKTNSDYITKFIEIISVNDLEYYS